MDKLDLRGVAIYPGRLDMAGQIALVDDIRAIARVAPFVQHVTPGGRKMSVRMTAAGQFGWVSDARGYRYDERHPHGMAWPEIPPSILQIWQSLCPEARAPECCLVNYYGEGARMGLHQDADEADFTQPVMSISLGNEGLFRVGSVTRGGKTASHWLRSGDVAVMGGEARLVHHGVDRIKFGPCALLPKGGRINLTIRVVR